MSKKNVTEKLKKLTDKGIDVETRHMCIDGVYRSIREIEESEISTDKKAEA